MPKRDRQKEAEKIEAIKRWMVPWNAALAAVPTDQLEGCVFDVLSAAWHKGVIDEQTWQRGLTLLVGIIECGRRCRDNAQG